MSQQTASLTNQFTPRGRFISGDLDRKQDKDYEGKPIAPDDQEYYFALAVPKTTPGANDLLGALHNLASTAYASNPAIMAQIGMGLNALSFSWKVEDGDAAKIDPKTGQPKAIPEYKQGCLIFKFRTKYEFGACDAQGNEINPSAIKRGDYMDVMFTASPNGRVDGNAGIILYPNAVRHLDMGEAISGKVNASDAFSGRQAETSGVAHPSAGQTFQPQQQPQQGMMPAAQQQPQQGMMPAAGNASGGNPAATGMPSADPNAAGGGMMPATGGMPAAQQGNPTASPSEMGVQPHQTILQGGGMPGVQ